MCGIYGLIETTLGQDQQRKVSAAMARALRHRGPDDHGTYEADGVLLGATRLAIVDVNHGKQPVRRTFGGKTAAIVYNGEIYNAADIVRDLARHGAVPQTRCDTELVLLAYLVHGPQCVERFNGQFAFAIWDEAAAHLFVARDHAGIKPLFYATPGGAFVFASEAKALFEHPRIPRRPNGEALVEYFLHGHAFASGYVTGQRTFYEGVKALPPGHTLTLKNGRVQLDRYWRAPIRHGRERSAAAWAGDVRDVLTSHIGAFTPTEVPVGVALSGGIDSSIITSLVTREMNARGQRPVACSIFYDGGQENADYHHASLVVADLRRQGFELGFERSVLSAPTYLSELDAMLTAFDEPHWEMKQLAMFRNYGQLKRSGAKAVLTGEGADELFFGYFKKFPGFLRPQLASGDELAHHWSFRVPLVRKLFHSQPNGCVAATCGRLMDESIAAYYAGGWDASDPDKRMQNWYFNTFLPWLLTVNDRCSMSWSLEGRFPFLDKDLVELALEMPARFNASGEGKHVLRDAFRDLLPPAIVDREKAPLPSPEDREFHRVVGRAFAETVKSSATSGIWDVLDRANCLSRAEQFTAAVEAPDISGLKGYMYLDDAYQTKTTHIFGLLTVLRWWHLNFEHPGS